jgi:two-component system, OmpR family, catabolic regulation response regulator CreB
LQAPRLAISETEEDAVLAFGDRVRRLLLDGKTAGVPGWRGGVPLCSCDLGPSRRRRAKRASMMRTALPTLNTMPPPRILLLEDETAIADTLIYALRSEGFDVDHVALAREALTAFASRAPDLAILDVGVPDGNGFDVCRAIRKRSEVPVVFLTARGEEIDRVLGLELGADDYVTKPFSPREVCARVKAILRRTAVGRGGVEPASSGRAEEGGVLQLDEAAQRIRCGGEPLALTRYEYLLLATLLKRPQRIFSRADLMDLVWADAPETSERTVDAHIKLVRAKLRACGLGAELIQTHRNMGYSFQAAG